MGAWGMVRETYVDPTFHNQGTKMFLLLCAEFGRILSSSSSSSWSFSIAIAIAIQIGISSLKKCWGETLGLKTSDAAHDKIRSMLATLGDPFTRIVSPQAGRCQCVRAVGLSVPRNGSMVRVESQLRAAGLSDGASEDSGEDWCGLCGDRRGWCTCGRCMGEGGFPTRPGLAGVKGKVGWARCKTCFGQKVVPCLFCGISEAPKWKLWLEDARRHSHRSRKQWKT